MTFELTPSIVDNISYQIPDRLRLPQFSKYVAFLEAYYSWLVQAGQPTDFITNLIQYMDIDMTTDNFRQHIISSILSNVPASSTVDRTLLSKHISSFLKAKGSQESFNFIMAAIYGVSSEMKWNGDKIFKASDSSFSRNAFLTIESSTPWKNVVGSNIIQIGDIPASAYIQTCEVIQGAGVYYNKLTLDDKNIVGSFTPTMPVQCLHNDINRNWYEAPNYFASSFYSNNKISLYATVEIKRPYETLIIRQIGGDFRAVITSLTSRTQLGNRILLEMSLNTVTGTYKHNVNNINDLYIVTPEIEPISYTTADFEVGIVSTSVSGVNITSNSSMNEVGDPVKFPTSFVNSLAKAHISKISAGSIDEILIIDGGFGHTVGQSILFDNSGTKGSGATATVSDIDGVDGIIELSYQLDTFNIVNGGDNFSVGDSITVSDGIGNIPLNLIVSSVNSSWLFKNIQIQTAGIGYPSYSNLALINTISGNIISGLSATLSYNSVGGISDIIINTAPSISSQNLGIILNGFGATSSNTISGGVITSVTVVKQGVNYINPFCQVIGDGVGAFITPVISNGNITSYNIISGGSGYTTASVIVSERFGSGFYATPIIQNQTASTGTITGLTISNIGSYQTLPQCNNVKFVTPTGINLNLNITFKLLSAVVLNGGYNYATPVITLTSSGTAPVIALSSVLGAITATSISNVGVGINSQPNAVISDSSAFGKVSKINITNYGSNYEKTPIPLLGNAKLVSNGANIGNISEITMTDSGYGYSGDVVYYTPSFRYNIIIDSSVRFMVGETLTDLYTGSTGIVTKFDLSRNYLQVEGSYWNLYTDYINYSTIKGKMSGSSAKILRAYFTQGVSLTAGNTFDKGKHTSTSGMLNSPSSVLPDNNRFQEYAYEITSTLPLNIYEKLLKSTVHPSGYKMFANVTNVSQVDLGMFDLVGQSNIASILYIISTIESSFITPDFNRLTDLFGDLSKFKYKNLPIDLIQNYNINQVSEVNSAAYDYYPSQNLTGLLSDWVTTPNIVITPNNNIAPDFSNTMTTIGDSSSITLSNVNRPSLSTVGNLYTLEMFILNKPSTTFARIGLDSSYIHINTTDSSYVKSSSGIFDVINLGEYTFVRISTIATAINIGSVIYPAAGLTSNMNSVLTSVTGSITVSNVVTKSVTGIVPVSKFLRAYNSNYKNDYINICNSESIITI